ncbi:MAG: hypothetical protein QF903_03465 [Planctomycetota bacterium]|jgi:hypothetical protein|nr:hypothetical protein [Planctomycetota bacterium]MDP6762497.1 hypothetical protein [Planctomycetota bacterium]MDP6988515.1 hypothetical protein [Planctomycetota bacterium]
MKTSLISATILGLLAASASAQLTVDETQQLLPPTAISGHQFGRAVACDGDRLVVGASDTATGGTDAAYVYVRQAGAWAHEATLTQPGGSTFDGFGRRVAIDGDTLVVCANHNGYAFVRNGSSWSYQDDLPPIGSGSYYSVSVALSGDTALIGQSGMTEAWVYVWVRSGSTWSLQTRLETPGGFNSTSFGTSVALVGETAFVGAPGDDQGSQDTGAVYVFERSGASWTQAGKITGSQPAPNRRLGTALAAQAALGGGFDVIGGGAGPTASGAFVFSGSGGSWTPHADIKNATGDASDWFGSSVAIAGNRIAVGAWIADTGAPNGGAATVFSRSGLDWVRQGDFVASDLAGSDGLASSTALAGDLLVLGAPFRDAGATISGAAYSYDLDAHAVRELCFGDGSATTCPCTNPSAPGAGEGCANSTGEGARLVCDDALQASTDKLRAYATGLLAGQPALLFSGEQAVNGGSGVVFGDGLRCAGGNTVRLAVRFADGAGEADWGPGLGGIGGWGAGDTRILQGWYRDPAASPCGSGFNLTNAVELTFVP